jgi:glucose uptake protein GlcU
MGAMFHPYERTTSMSPQPWAAAARCRLCTMFPLLLLGGLFRCPVAAPLQDSNCLIQQGIQVTGLAAEEPQQPAPRPQVGSPHGGTFTDFQAATFFGPGVGVQKSRGPALLEISNDVGMLRRYTEPDAIAAIFSLTGGLLMGSYPVPIKHPSVLEAKVHPVVFQCYKSFWAFVAGFVCVLIHKAANPMFTLHLSWLGVTSAAFWIPSSMSCIMAVQRLGMGMTLTVTTSTSTLLSFLSFWLIFGEKMKEYGSANGRHYYLAPVYLAGVILGMAALVSAPSVCRKDAKKGDAKPVQGDGGNADESAAPGSPGGLATTQGKSSVLSLAGGQDKFLLGLAIAIMSGVCATLQFGVVNSGLQYEERIEGCQLSPERCSPELQERFDVLGSWMASFGLGAVCISLASLLGLWMTEWLRHQPLTPCHWRVMVGPGNLAGVLWFCGNAFQLMAVKRGGTAVMMPANSSVSLVVAGLWGLFYYREVKNAGAVLWATAAIWTVSMIVLLSREKLPG